MSISVSVYADSSFLYDLTNNSQLICHVSRITPHSVYSVCEWQLWQIPYDLDANAIGTKSSLRYNHLNSKDYNHVRVVVGSQPCVSMIARPVLVFFFYQGTHIEGGVRTVVCFSFA